MFGYAESKNKCWHDEKRCTDKQITSHTKRNDSITFPLSHLISIKRQKFLLNQCFPAEKISIPRPDMVSIVLQECTFNQLTDQKTVPKSNKHPARFKMRFLLCPHNDRIASYTLSKISNWSPYIFCVDSVIQNRCFYKSTKAFTKLCM